MKQALAGNRFLRTRTVRVLANRPKKSRPIVLVFASYYVPARGAGGPVTTLQNLVRAARQDFEFRIITRDRDIRARNRFEGVSLSAWNKVEDGYVYYCRPSELRMGGLASLVRSTPHDLRYFNSLFDPALTVRPLLARRIGLLEEAPTVIAPRGELSGGALSLKRCKKGAFLSAAKFLGLYSNVFWQASGEPEARRISSKMGVRTDRIMVAPNLPTAIGRDRVLSHRDAGAPLRIVHLGRISPMKNLDFALRVLAAISCPVQFDLYGPVEDVRYWARCRQIVDKLPPNVSTAYRGPVASSEVGEVLADHDLLFLPSRGENYGHVIVEALSVGTPVLISDRTPWRGLAEANAGWALPLSEPNAFRRRIEEIANLGCDDYAAMRRYARAYALKAADPEEALEAWKGLVMRALDESRARDGAA